MSTGLIALETLRSKMVGFLRLHFNFSTIYTINYESPQNSAADGLMVSLVGLTLSITGAKIPGFTSKVQIKLM